MKPSRSWPSVATSGSRDAARRCRWSTTLLIGPDAMACGLLDVGAAPLFLIALVMGGASRDFAAMDFTPGKTSRTPASQPDSPTGRGPNPPPHNRLNDPPPDISRAR